MFSETALLAESRKAIASRLPSGWDVTLNKPSHRTDRRVDAIFYIQAPDGRTGRLVIEAKSRIEPRDVPRVIEQLAAYSSGSPLIAAPYLSPRARELLIEADVNYYDSTGNMRIALAEPGLYIERQGADTNPWPEERSLQSLKGPASGRVVRALCDLKPPYGIRELAELSQTPVATIARVVELLDAEAIVERTPRGPVTAVDWSSLIRRWTQDYTFAESNTTISFLEPRGLQALLTKLRTQRPAGYAVTGSLAASEVKAIAPPRLATIFVPSIPEAAERFDVRETEAGANVMLAEPYNEVVYERTWTRSSVTYAALSQVAADLLTGPGRGPAQAEELIRWMSGKEDAWRSQP